MSGLKSQVGPWKLRWKSIPKGRSGVAQVEVEGHGVVEVSWRMDSHGIWIQTPTTLAGFDLKTEVDDSGQTQFEVTQRNLDRQWKAVSVSVGDQMPQKAQSGGKPKAARVKSQMPGKILKIKVAPEDWIEKGQSVMVMEAMKMENEIRAPWSGRVTQIKVSEGQAIESGAELIWIDPA